MAPASKAVSLVLVHGNGGGAFRFDRVLPHAPPDVRLHAVTLPGFGGRPADPALRTMADYAHALAREVALAPRPKVVLGHGIGASLVLELVQHSAGEVDGMILHAPVGARLEQRWFPRLMRPRWMRELGKQAIAAPLLRPLWRRLLFRQPVPDDYLRRFFAEYSECAAFGQMFDLITPEWFASLQAAPVKGALLWGGRERVLRAGQAAEFRRLAPLATLEIVPHWDHFPMIEQPREYALTIARLAREALAG